LQYINHLGLYDTVFANHRDEVGVDTSSWEHACHSLMILLHDSFDCSAVPLTLRQSIRDLLIRNKNECYYSWMLAALSPWARVPAAVPQNERSRQPPPRAATIARDSLRADNKTINILTAAVKYREMISNIKTSFLRGSLGQTVPEIRQTLGQSIRIWGQDWRLCVVLAMLVEIMESGNVGEGERAFASRYGLQLIIVF
jgi:hypothetical protein